MENEERKTPNAPFSIRYFWSFLAHVLTSNSRHGTHSPFVYALADKAVYRRSRVGSSKETVVPDGFAPHYLPLLRDVLAHLSMDELADFGSDAEAPALLADLGEVSIGAIIEAVSAGKIVIVHEPFGTRSTKRLWQKLIREKTVTVSVNLFHFGLLLRRDGQRKEDFSLRYPFWRGQSARHCG